MPEAKLYMLKIIGRIKFVIILPKMLKGSSRLSKNMLPLNSNIITAASIEYLIME